MVAWLKRMLAGDTAKAGGSGPGAIAPDRPFVAIGDVHGRLDLLTSRLAAAGDMQVVLVGDYIDRGPDSAGVLELLHGRAAAGRTVCLAGNHEAMLLDFLDRPRERATLWLTNGGIQTLWSFGLEPGPGEAGAAMEALAAALRRRLGALEGWLRGLPLLWRSGNVAVVHAATDPKLPIDAQPRHILQWGRPQPGQPPRPDGIWVVHGHTIVPEVEMSPGRINLDTGAFRTGILSAARIAPGGIELLD